MRRNCRYGFLIAAIIAVGTSPPTAVGQQQLPQIAHPAGSELMYHDDSCEPRFRGGPCHDHCMDLWSTYCFDRRHGLRAPVRPFCGLGHGCLSCLGGLAGGGCFNGCACGSSHCASSHCSSSGCTSQGCASTAQPAPQPAVQPTPAEPQPENPNASAENGHADTTLAPANVGAQRATDATPFIAPPAVQAAEAAPSPVAPSQAPPLPNVQPSQQPLPVNVPSTPIPRNVTLPSQPEPRESKRIVPVFPLRLATAEASDVQEEVTVSSEIPVRQVSTGSGTHRLILQLQSLSR